MMVVYRPGIEPGIYMLRKGGQRGVILSIIIIFPLLTFATKASISV